MDAEVKVKNVATKGKGGKGKDKGQKGAPGKPAKKPEPEIPAEFLKYKHLYC